jgi:hypothetical protein
MRDRVIQEHDRRYLIRLMYRALAVSAAGYYAGRSWPESARSIQTRTLLSAIRVIHKESRETCGSPRIWRALREQGHRVGEHRVVRLMRRIDEFHLQYPFASARMLRGLLRQEWDALGDGRWPP